MYRHFVKGLSLTKSPRPLVTPSIHPNSCIISPYLRSSQNTNNQERQFDFGSGGNLAFNFSLILVKSLRGGGLMQNGAKCFNIWGYYENWGHIYFITQRKKCMQAQPGMVLGFIDMGVKRPDWGTVTLSPDGFNRLPK